MFIVFSRSEITILLQFRLILIYARNGQTAAEAIKGMNFVFDRSHLHLSVQVVKSDKKIGTAALI